MLSPTIVLLLVYYSECCVLILQLPKCLRVIGYLRRLATFNEQFFCLQVQSALTSSTYNGSNLGMVGKYIYKTSITSWKISKGSCIICCSYLFKFQVSVRLLLFAVVQNVRDMVHMCDYEEEDSKTTFIEKSVIKNVAGGMLHWRVTGKFYVFLTITII